MIRIVSLNMLKCINVSYRVAAWIHASPTRWRSSSRLDLLVNHDQAVPRVFPDGGKRVRLERRVQQDRLDVGSGG